MRNKTLLPLIVAIIFAAPALADDDAWTESLQKAQQLSKDSGKPIMANFTGSDWCPYCISLEKEIFSTEAFKKWAADNVILLKVDFPHHSQPGG